MQDQTNLHINPAQAEHLPALKAVIDSTGLFPSEFLDEMTAAYFQGVGEDQWLSIASDQHIVGVAYFAPERLTQGTWNLYLIAIAAEQQGKGIGARVMAHVEDHLRSQGQRLLIVETSGLPTFQYQRDFYARCGYAQEARIREFYAPGEDKVVFWKML